ncbi:MAG: putative B12-dependent methionine synthase [Candidatus Hodgkinia cicadicola]|nr:MAG: putative B12-dependent methionine synthase [Candidatus Hodgkinia cicadicola]
MRANKAEIDNVRKAISNMMEKRVLILDGAMGTQIQKYKLKTKHYKTQTFKTQVGNNDLLNIAQPKLIEKIHTDYIKAGADIIETNTFSSNQTSQLDYGTHNRCCKLNKYGALIARRACLQQAFNASRRLFTAGSIGPTNKTASISPSVLNPSCREIAFDELALSYKNQIMCLIKNKIDIVLIETIFDTLNAKAAIFAHYESCIKLQTKRPVILSATISDNSGRTLSGQTVEAFWTSIEHANPLCVGFNCALGADKLKQHVLLLASIADTAICAYPNAGLPNEFGEYSETPQQFANKIRGYVDNKLVNVIGGCCGSSPAHIAALKTLTANARPRKRTNPKPVFRLSGIDALTVERNRFYKIGERANVTGSVKFKRAITQGDYGKALDIVREQIANGASIIDINMDEALLDSELETKGFINLIGSEPDLSRTPLMIDSSNWSALLTGMKCTQGKCIVNSISLKDGERELLIKAQAVKMCGCAPIVIAFDELGQANSAKRRLQICNRAWKLLKKVGYKQHEVIFDLNTFAVATGLREHNNSAAELIKSIKLVTSLFPNINLSIGVSNLSFSFRGNLIIRESLHSVFLAHALKAGLNLGIVNVNKSINANELNHNVRSLCEQLIFNSKEVLIDEVVAKFGNQKRVERALKLNEAWRKWDLKSKLSHAVINGIEKFIEYDSIQLSLSCSPISIIEGPLMEGMSVVGKLFGLGRMFLPQVVKSARVMKKGVRSLLPLLRKTQEHVAHTILLATVKGDVHDIGKNIVGIVLSCNNYKIVDLGIMAPAAEIVKATINTKASIIGLSGLITPSLDEMINVAIKLQKSGVETPLLIGGATTSKVHTAIKIYPEYLNGITVHVANASAAVNVVARLLSKNKQSFVNSIRAEYELIASAYSKSKLMENRIEYNRVLKQKPRLEQKQLKTPNVLGSKLNLVNNLERVANSINWRMWGIERINQRENDVTQTRLASKVLNFIKTITKEQWFNIRCCTKISKALGVKQKIMVLNEQNKPIENIPMLSQQHRNSECLSLSDFVNAERDYVSALSCSVSYESVLIQRLFKTTGKQQLANVLKALCDKITEQCTSCVFSNIRQHFWGFLDRFSQYSDDGEKAGIRPAPGYPVCPDHHIKSKLTKLLNSKHKTGLIINNKHLITPQSSIIALALANKTALYFNIKNINADQIAAYTQSIKLSTQSVERTLNSIIGYIPSYIEH